MSKIGKKEKKPQPGIEPGTFRLLSECSATKLMRLLLFSNDELFITKVS